MQGGVGRKNLPRTRPVLRGRWWQRLTKGAIGNRKSANFSRRWSREDGAPRMQPEERLTIESTVQITDEIVAQKDRDIAELRRILAQQSDNIGSISIGAAAVAQNVGSG